MCPVILNLPEFSKNKLDEIHWFSYPFLTHVKGYRICVSVYPDDIDDTHLSVFLHLMKGPHDDELTWPLRGEFEVKLLNQISDCEHCPLKIPFDAAAGDGATSRIAADDEASVGWGDQLISYEDLNVVTVTCQYLKNDCLFLQVSKL